MIGTFSRLQKSQAFTLKLFRILCMHGKRLIDQLYGFGLKSVLKSAVFVHDNSITVIAHLHYIEDFKKTNIFANFFH